MNIQEYRKASAEKLGKEINIIHDPGGIHRGPIIRYKLPNDKDWHPDIDANQMLMVWDWLIKQGCILYYDNEDYHCFVIAPIIKRLRVKFAEHDKDIKLATAKAFMTYIKNK